MAVAPFSSFRKVLKIDIDLSTQPPAPRRV